MFFKAFASSLGLVFIAELGDKTQIAVLTLAARYGFLPVYAGAGLAFILLNVLAVSVGTVLYSFVPEEVIRYTAAAVFIIFGLLSFRPEKEEEESDGNGKNPFIKSFLAILLMEFGDKTQLSLIALSAKYSAPVWVFLGGTVALLLATAIGALVGKGIGKVIPLKWIKWISGVVFIVFGVLMAVGVW
ncbi:MAG: TMEM165/GDT1 family protein [Actinobacteria bacterium]|nr:TMEM165/GDT1 family protein [Actinomycetota bacterium]